MLTLWTENCWVMHLKAVLKSSYFKVVIWLRQWLYEHNQMSEEIREKILSKSKYFWVKRAWGVRFWKFVDIKKAWWIMFWPWWQIDHVVSMWYCCTLIIWYGVVEDFFRTSKTIRKSVNDNTQNDGGPSTPGLETLRKREKLPWPFFPTRPSSAYTYNPISNQEMMFVLDHESYT